MYPGSSPKRAGELKGESLPSEHLFVYPIGVGANGADIDVRGHGPHAVERSTNYRSGTKGWPRQAGVFTLVRRRFPEITTSAAMVTR